MLRISGIIGLGLAALGVASAGTIVNPDGTVNLTNATVTVATCTVTASPTCAANGTGFSGATGNSSGGYMNQLYSTANAATSPGNRPSGDFNNTNTSTTTPNAPSVPFDFQTNSLGKQIYFGTTATTDYQIVVNLGTGTAGVFGINDIYTMIQANALLAATPSTIIITATGVDASNNAITDQITLNSGVDYRDGNSLQGVTGTADGTGTATKGGAAGSTNSYNTGNVGVGTVTNTVNVFNDAFGVETKTTNSANYYQDVQQIILGGAFSHGYLDSVTITTLAAASSTQGINFTALTVATPEPGTTALFGLGFGMIAFLTIRRSRRAKV